MLVLPLVQAAVIELQLDRPPTTGDIAVQEIGVLNALHLDQLVGIYSRHGWSHPGPFQSYLLAPGYWLSGRSSWSLFASTALINLGALALMLVFWWRGYRDVLARLTLPALIAAHLLCLGSFEMQEWEIVTPLSAFWPPTAVVLPYGAFLLLCARAGGGGAKWLPALVVVHAFLAQTHAGCSLVATGALVVTLVQMGLAHRRRPRSGRTSVPWIGVCGVLLLVLWSPPLLDQITGTGNLAHLLDHGAGPPSFSFGSAVVHAALHASFWALPLFAEAGVPPIYSLVALSAVAAQLLLLVFAHRRARRCNDTFSARLLVILAAQLAFAVLASGQ